MGGLEHSGDPFGKVIGGRIGVRGGVEDVGGKPNIAEVEGKGRREAGGGTDHSVEGEDEEGKALHPIEMWGGFAVGAEELFKHRVPALNKSDEAVMVSTA